MPVVTVVRWLAHALWEDERTPSSYEVRSTQWRWKRERWKVKRGQCGVAVRIPFHWRLEILSGAAFRAEWRTEIIEEFRYYGVLTDTRSADEVSTSCDFAWGLARDFGVVGLTASLRKTLDPTEPIGLLDIAVRF